MVSEMTTVSQLSAWFDRGVRGGASHMIVKWDSFDGPDGHYPLYVMPDEDARAVDRANGDRTVEVYILNPERRAEQLRPGIRVWNWE